MMMIEKMRQARQESGIKGWHVAVGLLVTGIIVVVVLFATGVISTSSLGLETPSVMSIRISRPRSLGTDADIHHLHISEVEAFKNGETVPMELRCADPCTNPMGPEVDLEAAKAFDKDIETTYHNKYTGQYDEAAPFYGTEDHFLHLIVVDAKKPEDVARIKIHHKHPQKRRIVGATIELLKDGTKVWDSTFVGEADMYEFAVILP